jgi:hypothetical protein
MNKIEAQLIADKFVAMKNNVKARLKTGADERDKMAASIEKGETVKGYRMEFHVGTSKKLFELLATEARAFNLKYPEDRISVQDMLDVLLSAGARLAGK